MGLHSLALFVAALQGVWKQVAGSTIYDEDFYLEYDIPEIITARPVNPWEYWPIPFNNDTVEKETWLARQPNITSKPYNIEHKHSFDEDGKRVYLRTRQVPGRYVGAFPIPPPPLPESERSADVYPKFDLQDSPDCDPKKEYNLRYNSANPPENLSGLSCKRLRFEFKAKVDAKSHSYGPYLPFGIPSAIWRLQNLKGFSDGGFFFRKASLLLHEEMPDLSRCARHIAAGSFIIHSANINAWQAASKVPTPVSSLPPTGVSPWNADLMYNPMQVTGTRFHIQYYKYRYNEDMLVLERSDEDRGSTNARLSSPWLVLEKRNTSCPLTPWTVTVTLDFVPFRPQTLPIASSISTEEPVTSTSKPTGSSTTVSMMPQSRTPPLRPKPKTDQQKRIRRKRMRDTHRPRQSRLKQPRAPKGRRGRLSVTAAPAAHRSS